MRKLIGILLSFWLIIFTLSTILPSFGPVIYAENSDTIKEVIADRPADHLLLSTPASGLVLSEIIVENDSEAEPREAGHAALTSSNQCILASEEYLKQSRLILISLSVRDLIFPFHTHL